MPLARTFVQSLLLLPVAVPASSAARSTGPAEAVAVADPERPRVGGIDISTPVGKVWRLRGVGDLDGDETDDILWQHQNGQVHYWPMLNGQRVDGLDIYTPVNQGWVLRGVGDVDGDGTDDIVWQHQNGQVHYWPMEFGQR